jgi:hypothetical protein
VLVEHHGVAGRDSLEMILCRCESSLFQVPELCLAWSVFYQGELSAVAMAVVVILRCWV